MKRSNFNAPIPIEIKTSDKPHGPSYCPKRQLGDVIKINGRDHIVTQDDLDRWDANLQAMFSARRAPGSMNTNTGFSRGKSDLRSSFDGTDEQFNLLIKEARKRGYNPQSSDHYNPMLADDFGGPLGFVPSADPLGHIKAVAEHKNITVHGAVEHKSYQEDKDPFAPDKPKKRKKKTAA